MPQPRGWAFWRNLLRQRNVLLLCIAYMPNCATFYFCITWLPTYLMKQHGFEKAELGMVAALPLLLSTGTQFLGGWLSDRDRAALRAHRRAGARPESWATRSPPVSSSPRVSRRKPVFAAVMIGLAAGTCMLTTATVLEHLRRHRPRAFRDRRAPP